MWTIRIGIYEKYSSGELKKDHKMQFNEPLTC